MTKKELFIKLASPDKNGVSRWVSRDEFTGEYISLHLGNGRSWCRNDSTIANLYIVEVKRDITPGNSIDAIRLNGFNTSKSFNQTIRSDIYKYHKDRRCVMLGIKGTSENTKIEVDHKCGRKNEDRVSNSTTQEIADFQPLCKAANDVKRQICKMCKVNNVRWDATNIEGNPYPFYEGDATYIEELGCVGCYQYDPVEYRKSSARRISQEASDYIMGKLYPNK